MLKAVSLANLGNDDKINWIKNANNLLSIWQPDIHVTRAQVLPKHVNMPVNKDIFILPPLQADFFLFYTAPRTNSSEKVFITFLNGGNNGLYNFQK